MGETLVLTEAKKRAQKKYLASPKGKATRRSYMAWYVPLYRQKHPIKVKRWKHTVNRNRKVYYEKKRLEALGMVGPLECVGCGCTNTKVLEFNLKGGNHRKLANEGVVRETPWLVFDIISGRTNPHLFDVRCRVCNMVYYVKLKFGAIFIATLVS